MRLSGAGATASTPVPVLAGVLHVADIETKNLINS
jgi:hypothetical protein